MFKDEITLYSNTPGDLKPVDLKRTGIAWESDIEYRFKNPTAWLTEDFKTKHVKPKGMKALGLDLTDLISERISKC